MRVLLDNNVNRRLSRLIKGHEVIHAREMGWAELRNGDLIAAAEADGFDVMITADKQMRHQQNLSGRKLSIVVLNSLFMTWPQIVPLAPQVQAALDGGMDKGSFIISPNKEPF